MCDGGWEGGTHHLAVHICKGLSLVMIFVLFPLSVWRKIIIKALSRDGNTNTAIELAEAQLVH